MKSLTFKALLIAAIAIIPKPLTASTNGEESTTTPGGDKWGAACVLQYAGNMGMFSTGASWSYGRKRQWETDALAGFLPAASGHSPRLTLTLKENYIPWSIPTGKGWSVSPLTTSLYASVLCGHGLWWSQPGRYPDGYYTSLSTRLRFNLSLGQRIEKSLTRSCPVRRDACPGKKSVRPKALTLFYEASICDLYIRSLFMKGFQQPLKDLITLSAGARLRIR